MRVMKKKEDFNRVKLTLTSFLHWLPAPAGLFLAILKDDPALTEAALAALLSPRELVGGRFGAAPAVTRHWLLGRLAAKAAAGRRWGLSPAAVEIISTPEGRPLCGRSASPMVPAAPRRDSTGGGEGFVSISHTSGAAAGAAAGDPVGLDLELWSRPINDRVWAWAFSPAERNLAAETAGWPTRLALWCAKEAAAKSWGRGLLNHLNQVRVAAADWPSGRLTVTWPDQTEEAREVCLIRWESWLAALAFSHISR